MCHAYSCLEYRIRDQTLVEIDTDTKAIFTDFGG